ncbi:hypothetical protein AAW12_18680 [Sphingobacterium sp. Ag1]|uniref:Kelch repeat-containing protein n=1 Tax=Sphingobacterium sp. Ag1 TaxID=1643451 RepID=UPI000627660C|nr:hypothetical protein [Sphingobacterium sp. Ag1]KKO89649.1 hypothetical protein AAW12_18680 [Sphingobacterium sp. Ag1]
MKSILIFFINLLWLCCYQLSGQGLKFQGSGILIEKRPSLHVFEYTAPQFSGDLSIDFELSFQDLRHFGYICYYQDENERMPISLIYNNLGNGRSRFTLNKEGALNLISLELDQNQLKKNVWIPFNLKFDALRKKISLTIGKVRGESNYNFSERTFSPKPIFGLNPSSVDVPSFSLRDLKIYNTKKAFFFGFDEHEGTIVHDQKSEKVGAIKNPVWLIKDAYHWKKLLQFQTPNTAGIAYHPSNALYFIAKDSLRRFSLEDETLIAEAYANTFPLNNWSLGMILPMQGNTLAAYEIASSSKEPTLTYLHLNTKRWSPALVGGIGRQMHQHTHWADSADSSLYTFGGYGNQQYFNEFYRLKSQGWEKLDFTGELPTPRFYSSWGKIPGSKEMLLFGGIGNASGDQTLGRTYYYDFFKVDLANKKIRSLGKIAWKNKDMVFARNLIYMNDSNVYGLCYPEYEPNSFAQLVQFDLKQMTYKMVGDSIPFRSDMITTNLNLFYNPEQKKFIVTTQVFEDSGGAKISVYSLNYPAYSLEQLLGSINSTGHYKKWIILLSLFGAIAILLYLKFWSKKKGASAVKVKTANEAKAFAAEVPLTSLPVVTERTANSIYFIGHFAAYDSKGRVITHLFSQRLKNIFLILAAFKGRQGISSTQLSQILWPGRDEYSVKNLRGVTLNQLRKAISGIDGIQIIFEEGLFKVQCQDNFFCDLLEIDQLLRQEGNSSNEILLLQLLHRGEFLLEFSEEYTKILLNDWKENVLQHWVPYWAAEIKNESTNHMTALKTFHELFPLDETIIRLYLKSLAAHNLFSEYQKTLNRFKELYLATYHQPYAGNLS